jgi:hypothetical protein
MLDESTLIRASNNQLKKLGVNFQRTNPYEIIALVKGALLVDTQNFQNIDTVKDADVPGSGINKLNNFASLSGNEGKKINVYAPEGANKWVGGLTKTFTLGLWTAGKEATTTVDQKEKIAKIKAERTEQAQKTADTYSAENLAKDYTERIK